MFSVCMCISVCASISLSVCMYACLSLCLCLSNYKFVSLLVCLSDCPFVFSISNCLTPPTLSCTPLPVSVCSVLLPSVTF